MMNTAQLVADIRVRSSLPLMQQAMVQEHLSINTKFEGER